MKSTRSSRSSAPTLRLREIDHTYWHGSEPIIGATETLVSLGIFDPTRYPLPARDRGDRVHRHTSALDQRKRRRPPVQPEETGYVASWRAFVAQWEPDFILIEAALWCPTRRVAGTIDRLAILRRPGLPKHLALIDLKTGIEERWHAYQLSIYDILIDTWLRSPEAPRALRRLPRFNYSAYLKKDGRPPTLRVRPFEPVVHSFIAAAQAKRRLLR